MERSRQTANKSTIVKVPRKELAGKVPRQMKTSGGQERIRPHHYRPGTVELCEISKYQRSTELLVRKALF